ncbi:SH3 domain-containing protein C23A1.17-like isoform X2 [Nasonia vitripennis]|uniref:Uncharacterized protein n=1 Tax=Nasonia vitripennis TaxID=7425 RepID=A0A7M7PVG5_NASVI|nr:SH3 domain-containing protein C23A1.17-like isoform X2 [Nasonia vitripennis]
MAKTGMGTLLSVIFLILGTTFLPEPIDAAPQDYQSRSERSPSPDPRCPNCPKDCPESLSGRLPERESEVEQYSAMAKPPYAPPAYNAVQQQQQYSVQQPGSYAAPPPPRPPSPLYSVAQPPPSYSAPPPAAYAHQPAAAYPSPPVRPAYAVPQPSYGAPPPPAHPAAYGAPPPPPPPASYAAPPPPPPPPASYAAPPPAPPASYAAPPPARPSPPASYNQPPPPATYSQPSPPASYNQSPPPASYNPPSLTPPPASYNPPSRPPPPPPPPVTEKPLKITLSRPSPPPSTKSSYPNKLPPPPAIPNEPPLSDKPCFKQPPPPPSKPKTYDPLPMPRYNHLTNPWAPIAPPAQYRSFGYNPYAPSPYQPNYLNARPTYSCSCDDFDLDDEDEAVFSKYNRRSSDNRYYRHSGHHQDHFVDPLNSPTSMYKNYRPYDRDEARSVFSDEFGSEESTGSSKEQPRERLYVVYRADAMKDKTPSSSAPVMSYLTEDQSMSDREIESMIRRAIDISRLQRSHQDNVLYSRTDPRYQYQHVSQQLDSPAEQPEFKSLAQQQYESQYPVGQYQMSPVQMMDNEGQYVVREEGDEANNPGWDQTKWTAVPAMSSDFDNPENVYAANVGVSNGESVVPTETEPAAPAVVPPVEVGEETQHSEEIQPESRLEKKEIGEPEAKENKTEEVDLIEDMEAPQTVTEASSFDKHAETTTDDGM